MKKLDKSQDHDTVHGTDELGRAFYQDGAYFDLEGNEVVEDEGEGDDGSADLTDEEIAAKAAAAEEAKAAKAAKAAAAKKAKAK